MQGRERTLTEKEFQTKKKISPASDHITRGGANTLGNEGVHLVRIANRNR
jgi:hypothetical protein